MTRTDNMVDTDVDYIPHRCPICARIPRAYTGKLVRTGEAPPVCENHKKALKTGRLSEAQITMVPVPGFVSRRERAAA